MRPRRGSQTMHPIMSDPKVLLSPEQNVMRELIGGTACTMLCPRGRACTSSGCRIVLAAGRWAASSGAESINTWRGVHLVRGSALELGPPAQDAPGKAIRLQEVKRPQRTKSPDHGTLPRSQHVPCCWDMRRRRDAARGVNGPRLPQTRHLGVRYAVSTGRTTTATRCMATAASPRFLLPVMRRCCRRLGPGLSHWLGDDAGGGTPVRGRYADGSQAARRRHVGGSGRGPVPRT
jgi:hypothetical protein